MVEGVRDLAPLTTATEVEEEVEGTPDLTSLTTATGIEEEVEGTPDLATLTTAVEIAGAEQKVPLNGPQMNQVAQVGGQELIMIQALHPPPPPIALTTSLQNKALLPMIVANLPEGELQTPSVTPILKYYHVTKLLIPEEHKQEAWLSPH